MDRPAAGRPRPHADRAVRLAGRCAALPCQPDPRAPAAGVPQAAGPGPAARAAGARHRQPGLRARHRAGSPHAAAARPGQGRAAVRDSDRDDGAADRGRGLHQAPLAARRGGAARRVAARPGPHPPDQRRAEGLRDHTGVCRWPGGARGHRRVCQQRRPGLVDRLAGAARAAARTTACYQRRRAQRPGRWRQRPATAAVGRRGAGAGHARAAATTQRTGRRAGAVGNHHARAQRAGKRLPHAGRAARHRQQRRLSACRHAAAAAAR